jgi:hypothetical protein
MRRGSPKRSEHPRPLSEEAQRRDDQDRHGLGRDLRHPGHLDKKREQDHPEGDRRREHERVARPLLMNRRATAGERPRAG